VKQQVFIVIQHLNQLQFKPRNKISVQPNPAKNSFEVLIDFPVEETISLTIMDILGNVVYWQETTLTATANPITISSEHLPSPCTH
jgi:hypothetical protein